MDQNYVVQNVLYIPENKYNLLSLGQLMDESEYFITLSNGMFVVQDSISRMPIRLAVQRNEILSSDL